MIAFGPVPSRRFGRSLGINNIPPKHCSYSCVYCQVGRTTQMQVQRREFYGPREIYDEVAEKVEKAQEEGIKIDYLTFVPDGEPTLDQNLRGAAVLLRKLGIRLAVISNASLIGRKEIQSDLCAFDLVSLKIDAVREDIWRKINRPHKSLRLDEILQGISGFSDLYRGRLITETMLIAGMNDDETTMKETARFISGVKFSRSYMTVPIRPPAEKNVQMPRQQAIETACQIFRGENIDVECLVEYEGNEFTLTGDVEQDLLGILSVHPMREEAVSDFLARAGKNWDLIERLMIDRKVSVVNYEGKNFYKKGGLL